MQKQTKKTYFEKISRSPPDNTNDSSWEYLERNTMNMLFQTKVHQRLDNRTVYTLLV